MKIVNTQAELEAAVAAGPDEIEVASGSLRISVSAGRWSFSARIGAKITVEARGSSHVVAWESSHVVAWESSHVEARGSSHVEARGSSHVVAWESSHVVAWESSHVVAWESSHVVARESSHVVARGSSHVEARESSHVEASGSSHVVARESSHVEARGSSHVEAWESSHVEASGSSHVVARESSHVEARGSSHVVAWESSHVVAWESSHVEARGNVFVRLFSALKITASAHVPIMMHGRAAEGVEGGRQLDVMPEPKTGAEWCEYWGIDPATASYRIAEIDSAILSAIEADKVWFDMGGWHGEDCDETNWCKTTHCRAGAAICLAGKAGFDLERKFGAETAGQMIYAASRPLLPLPDFYAPTDEAMDDIRSCAEAEKAAS